MSNVSIHNRTVISLSPPFLLVAIATKPGLGGFNQPCIEAANKKHTTESVFLPKSVQYNLLARKTRREESDPHQNIHALLRKPARQGLDSEEAQTSSPPPA